MKVNSKRMNRFYIMMCLAFEAICMIGVLAVTGSILAMVIAGGCCSLSATCATLAAEWRARDLSRESS